MKKQRLLKLAKFLEKLPRNKFDFSDIVAEYSYERQCGSVCCAVGWTPTLWPNIAYWWEGVTVETSSSNGYIEVAKELFNISYNDADALFTPRQGNLCGLRTLNANATPKAVAKNIRLYVKNA